MGIEHDSTWKFVCDNCGRSETYATVPQIQRPFKWGKLQLEYTELDEHGNALANHTDRKLLCGDCLQDYITEGPSSLNTLNEVSSPELSALAGKYLKFDEQDIMGLEPATLVGDIKALAGSVLTQAEDIKEVE